MKGRSEEEEVECSGLNLRQSEAPTRNLTPQHSVHGLDLEGFHKCLSESLALTNAVGTPAGFPFEQYDITASPFQAPGTPPNPGIQGVSDAMSSLVHQLGHESGFGTWEARDETWQEDGRGAQSLSPRAHCHMHDTQAGAAWMQQVQQAGHAQPQEMQPQCASLQLAQHEEPQQVISQHTRAGYEKADGGRDEDTDVASSVAIAVRSSYPMACEWEGADDMALRKTSAAHVRDVRLTPTTMAALPRSQIIPRVAQIIAHLPSERPDDVQSYAMCLPIIFEPQFSSKRNFGSLDGSRTHDLRTHSTSSTRCNDLIYQL